MAISFAVEKEDKVTIYDENHVHVSTVPGELHGYTHSTVSVRADGLIKIYDERGRLQTSFEGGR